jgi:hypothetical protein
LWIAAGEQAALKTKDAAAIKRVARRIRPFIVTAKPTTRNTANEEYKLAILSDMGTRGFTGKATFPFLTQRRWISHGRISSAF